MDLKIIGAGFGRTGTSSVREALGDLGYKCYHMSEVLFSAERKSDIDFWREAWATEDRTRIDWNRLYDGFDATIDFPGSAFWKELSEAFPESKVILTHHPKGPEGWYDSTVSTIYGGMGPAGSTEFGRKVNDLMNEIVWDGMLRGTMDDRDAAIARYNEHTEEVRDTIPADRLLVFSADQGWGPLTSFLGVDYREGAFPKTNDREAMARTVARLKRMKDFGRMKG